MNYKLQTSLVAQNTGVHPRAALTSGKSPGDQVANLIAAIACESSSKVRVRLDPPWFVRSAVILQLRPNQVGSDLIVQADFWTAVDRLTLKHLS